MNILKTICGCMALFMVSCTAHQETKTYVDYVNPFIGTGGHGHTYPGAVVPFGMIQPSPDTRIYEWDACSGYHYSDSTINGFSHTHLSGTGCCDYGDILIMPTVGVQEYQWLGPNHQQTAYNSRFSHENEIASPGYYSVFLDRYGVKAELTASQRAAIHRYTFPKSDQSGFIIDLDYNLQGQRNHDMEIVVLSNTEIWGGKRTSYWAPDQPIYFYMKFSKPFAYTLITDTVKLDGVDAYPMSKALLQFETQPDEEVYVKVAVSAVDKEGAKKNLENDIKTWNFNEVHRNALDSWNDYLSKIDIETTDDELKTIFYTSMYHTGLQPSIFTDADGRYFGMDHQIHQGDINDPQYTVFSLWDTFRALHPLMTIIDPDRNEAFIRSLLQKYREGGMLPMWELAGNYTATMIGYHGVSVIADAYAKGYRNSDVEEAYKASLHSSEYDTTGFNTIPLLIHHGLMLAAKYWKHKIGYVPCDKDHEAVAKALEYAYNDWCISMMADSLGDIANKEKYERFAEAYKIYFDPEVRFMRGKDSQGKWRTPFNPRSSEHRADDYCEGTAWQWTWFVPHQVDGLVELMGGREAFIGKLDSLFTADSSLEGGLVSSDITGLIGQYAHGNEPSHHIIHLYNYVDEPHKTQELCDSVMYTLYFNEPDGLSGNEDCGQMSAWFIMNGMGFYQVCPGKPVYSIGRPMFDKSSIKLKDGKEFVIIAHNNSRENKYIQSMKLNGQVLNEPFFTHNDVTQGGVLEFVMGDKPKK